MNPVVNIYDLTFCVTFASNRSFREVAEILSASLFDGRRFEGDFDYCGHKHFPLVEISLGLRMKALLFEGMNGVGTYSLYCDSSTHSLFTLDEMKLHLKDFKSEKRSGAYKSERVDISCMVAETVRRCSPFVDAIATSQKYPLKGIGYDEYFMGERADGGSSDDH